MGMIITDLVATLVAAAEILAAVKVKTDNGAAAVVPAVVELIVAAAAAPGVDTMHMSKVMVMLDQ
jgi:hypothetical protein